MSRVVLFNKPFGVLCQFGEQDGRPVLADHIDRPGVYPAGRLDHDSEGLLLLTDDGLLQARIADPRFKLAKTYWAQVDGAISDAAIARLAAGVELNDGPTLPADCHRLETPALWERVPPVRYRAAIPTSWIALTIREGRNRQVRRMTAAVGFPTLRLVRVAIGPWSLEGLAPGEWKEIEVNNSDLPAPPDAAPGPGRRPPTPRRQAGDERSFADDSPRSGQDPRRRTPSTTPGQRPLADPKAGPRPRHKTREDTRPLRRPDPAPRRP